MCSLQKIILRCIGPFYFHMGRGFLCEVPNFSSFRIQVTHVDSSWVQFIW